MFNVLLIARAPLQLFQAIQTSLLPHLSGLEATEGHEAFARAIRVTMLAIAAFAGAVALGLLLIGPLVMDVLFGDGLQLRARRAGRRRGRHGPPPRARARSTRPRWPAATRAPRRRAVAGRARRCSSRGWSCRVVDDELVRAEIGYAGAAALLCALLRALYRR